MAGDLANQADALTGVSAGYDFFRKKIRVALAAGLTPDKIVSYLDGADEQIAREMLRRIIVKELDQREQLKELENADTVMIKKVEDKDDH